MGEVLLLAPNFTFYLTETSMCFSLFLHDMSVLIILALLHIGMHPVVVANMFKLNEEHSGTQYHLIPSIAVVCGAVSISFVSCGTQVMPFYNAITHKEDGASLFVAASVHIAGGNRHLRSSCMALCLDNETAGLGQLHGVNKVSMQLEVWNNQIFLVKAYADDLT
ncbi:hypothetical protein ABZP36_028012 [Zizania latifolia]